MPELPEVETIRRQLEKTIVGKKIATLDFFDAKVFAQSSADILNKKIESVNRQAKMLLISLGGGLNMAVHLKMTGRLLFERKKPFEDIKFARAIINFSDGSRLVFADARKFGWIKIISARDKLKPGAIEPLNKNFTLAAFLKIARTSKKPIKLLLMDQQKIGGIGNIYANESLFDAKISPFRPAASLTSPEIKRLYTSIEKILKKAIACHGSSGKDEWYCQIDGRPGNYQKHFLVYQRQGEKCFACSGKVARQKQQGRGTFFCPLCQK